MHQELYEIESNMNGQGWLGNGMEFHALGPAKNWIRQAEERLNEPDVWKFRLIRVTREVVDHGSE